MEILAHDWLCGRVDVPTTPLMTPDVLDMSGSHVGTALRVAMNVYHKAARSGFTLMDVANAPLAKRRKKKITSIESHKGSDDGSTSTNVQSLDSSFEPDLSTEEEFLQREKTFETTRKRDVATTSAVRNIEIPPLAVCLSPSCAHQTVVDTSANTLNTSATAREPPPLRPISADSDYYSQSSRLTNSGSNFFFKDVKAMPSSHKQTSSSSDRSSAEIASVESYRNTLDLSRLNPDLSRPNSSRTTDLSRTNPGLSMLNPDLPTITLTSLQSSDPRGNRTTMSFNQPLINVNTRLPIAEANVNTRLPIAETTLPSEPCGNVCVQYPTTSFTSFSYTTSSGTKPRQGQPVDMSKTNIDNLNNNNNNNNEDVSTGTWKGYSKPIVNNTRKRQREFSLD